MSHWEIQTQLRNKFQRQKPIGLVKKAVLREVDMDLMESLWVPKMTKEKVQYCDEFWGKLTETQY